MAPSDKVERAEGANCFYCNTPPGGIHMVDCPGDRDPPLVEREKTHGSFQQNADISSALKVIFREHDEKILSSIHREALDMIALKLSRILSGQANFKDHWRDLSGYSLLAMEACDEDIPVQK